MSNYPDLYQRLAREIIKHEGIITGDAAAFVDKLIKRLQAEGRHVTPAVQAEISDYLAAMQSGIQAGIVAALTVATGAMPVPLQSAAVASLAKQAYTERWPDGLNLSQRLWNWEQDLRLGLTKTVQAGIAHGNSVNKIVYAMQRKIESVHGDQRFKIVETYKDDWVTELHQSATALIHDPSARALWNATVADAEERILSLSANGSRSASERVLSQMQKAVLKGSEELVDKAAKWWLYDKQLYHLKRIARTEMATAMHRAVIASVEGDDSIIGFQWRLSGSHPATDICDYYANIEMGLGKGVWTKEAVPHHKAHPHCMCLLIPRVTRIKQAGSKNYGEFIKNANPERRDQLLPAWARQAMDKGVSLNNLVRPDGLGLLSKQAALKAGLLPTLSPVYQAAKEGGIHHGLLKNYSELPAPMIERAIRSMEKQIDLHKGWVKNPYSKLNPNEDLRRVSALVNEKWPSDIRRIQAEAEVLRGLLQDKK